MPKIFLFDFGFVFAFDDRQSPPSQSFIEITLKVSAQCEDASLRHTEEDATCFSTVSRVPDACTCLTYDDLNTVKLRTS